MFAFCENLIQINYLMPSFKIIALKNTFLLFAVVTFGFACSPKLKISKNQKQIYTITQTMPVDSDMLAFYKPYKLILDSVMNDVVAISELELTRNQPEGTLNNFFADALFESAQTANINFDIVFTNVRGLRLPLPKGEIYRYKIFELMPFENSLVSVQFDGKNTQRFFDYVAKDGGHPISGASFTIFNNKAIDIVIAGKPFDNLKSYTILTSDYMANGGDKGAVFYLGTNRKDYNYLMRTAILQYLEKQKKAGKTLNPKLDGRIKIK